MNVIKKLIYAAAILLLLLIAAVLFLPAFIDVNDYKAKIEQLAEQSLGRKIAIKGDLELKTFPTFRIKTGELTLANPPEYPQPYMLEVKSAEIGVQILPLLTKKIEAGKLKLEAPTINLIKKSDSDANWIFAQQQPSSEPQSADSNPAITDLAIQGIEISNAAINYLDLSTDTLANLSNLNLTTGAISLGNAFALQLSTLATSSALTDSIDLNLTAQAVISQNLSKLGLTDLDSQLKLGEQALQLATPFVGFDVENNHLSSKQFKISAPIDADNTAMLDLTEVDFNLDQLLAKANQIKLTLGSAGIDLAGEIPALSFDANHSMLTLADSDFNFENTDISGQIHLPATKLDLSKDQYALKNITGKLVYENLTSQLNITDIIFDSKTNGLDINSATAKLDDAALNLQAKAQLEPLSIDFQLQTSDLDLKQLLSSLDIEFQTKAQALTDLDLTATGRFENENLQIDKIAGNLDQTTIEGSASILNLADPQYRLNLNLGELEIDQYLPESQANHTASSNSDQTTAAAPIDLSTLKLDAKINAKRLSSAQNNIAIDNLKFNTSTADNQSQLTFSGAVNGEALPERLALTLKTQAKLSKESINFKKLDLSTQGQSIAASVNIPAVTLPLNATSFEIANVKINFNNDSINSQLNFPVIAYDSANSVVLANKISGTAKLDKMSANILVPHLSANLNKQLISVNELAVDLNGQRPVGRINIPTIKLNLEQLSLAGATNVIFEGQDGRAEISLKNGASSDQAAGAIYANNFNLRGVLNRLNVLTDLESKSALSNISISSPFSVANNAFNLNDLSAQIDETSVKGVVKANFSERPSYNFDIKVGNLDADRYIPASSDSATTNASQTVGAPIEIPADLLRQLNALGQLHFDQLSIGGAKFNDLNIGLSAQNGKISISPLKSGFFAGSMDGDLKLDSSTSTAKIDSSYQLQNVILDQALSSLGISDKLSGQGNFDLSMQAAGKTDQALLSSLTGSAKLKVDNGIIKGVNLQDILFKGYQAYASLKNKTVNEKYNPGEQTEFSQMTGSWNIKQGVIYGNDLDIKAPLFRISGQGNVSLVSNRIDYDLKVNVVKSLEGQGGKSLSELKGRTIPLKIYGSLDNPQYKLDISGLLADTVQSKAEEKIQEKIEDKLGEKLEGEGSLQEKLQQKAQEKIGEKLFDLFN